MFARDGGYIRSLLCRRALPQAQFDPYDVLGRRLMVLLKSRATGLSATEHLGPVAAVLAEADAHLAGAEHVFVVARRVEPTDVGRVG